MRENDGARSFAAQRIDTRLQKGSACAAIGWPAVSPAGLIGPLADECSRSSTTASEGGDMSFEEPRPGSDRTDPQLPTMIGARVAAYSAGLLLAMAGGLLAADLPAVDPAVLVASVHQRPV